MKLQKRRELKLYNYKNIHLLKLYNDPKLENSHLVKRSPASRKIRLQGQIHLNLEEENVNIRVKWDPVTCLSVWKLLVWQPASFPRIMSTEAASMQTWSMRHHEKTPKDSEIAIRSYGAWRVWARTWMKVLHKRCSYAILQPIEISWCLVVWWVVVMYCKSLTLLFTASLPAASWNRNIIWISDFQNSFQKESFSKKKN